MSTAHDLAVDIPVFSGPFKLLTDLILDQKVDVCDVPVARITDAYLRAGLEGFADWSLDEATWFLAVCAVLLDMKVSRLLPRPEPDAEEDLVGGLSPDLVYARSLELAAFRVLAEDFAQRMSQAALMVPRTGGPPPEFAHLYPDPMERVTVEDLRALAATLLAPPAMLDLSHVTPIRASLSDALAAVRAQLALTPEASFRDLLENCEERIEVVVRFLAVLELHRQGKVQLSQAQVFGDIHVTWNDADRDGDDGMVEEEGSPEVTSMTNDIEGAEVGT
jgi:segregation and condensation protein A